MELSKLENTISYIFKDRTLLEKALTHRSYSKKNNERLEFLGDSILNFTMAHTLFECRDDIAEGQLSRLRANLVKGETLAKVALTLNLGDYLLLGTGEMRSGGARRESMLADALEALIAAIYLDADMPTCQQAIKTWFKPFIEKANILPDLRDPKSRLQEYLQARRFNLPEYRVSKTEGLEHEQQFFIECHVSGFNFFAIGKGRGRRKAEQAAAEQFLEWLIGSDKT